MKRLAIPKYFIFDVDGVLTTGQFLYSSRGKEYKVFGPHDNDGIKLLSSKMKIIFLTADKRGYDITEKRIVKDMKQELCLVSEEDRYSFIEKTFGVKKVIYMGDGFYDCPILRDCRFGIAPKNARREAKAVADYVTPSNSGEGAVLDACLKVLRIFFRVDHVS
jgi:3-deoxy-D-manno-octulosonate 8-phosphate phosphatase (KDO 8-P phosphatase)